MDVISAILVCLFTGAFAAVSIIHTGMDRQKMRAMLYAKQMIVSLDKWVLFIVKQMESSDFDAGVTETIQGLADAYFNKKRKKESIRSIHHINSIITALSTLDNDQYIRINLAPGNTEVDFMQLYRLQSAYNSCVEKLNNRLNKRIPAIVGKLTRVGKLEELMSLTYIPRLEDN